MAQIQAIKGFADLFPAESRLFQRMEAAARAVFPRYAYGELRTPLMEYTELFCRSIGTETDVVQKEMYPFNDKGNRSITLKPEGTAGLVRAFLENRPFNEALPQKMYYLNSPVFRYEEPQA